MNSQDSSKVTQKAQKILNTFMNEMDAVTISHQYTTSRPQSFREEGEAGLLASDEFRELFLQNATKRNSDAIITKKGDWV